MPESPEDGQWSFEGPAEVRTTGEAAEGGWVSLRVTIAKVCALRLLSPHAASDDEYMRLSR